MGTEEYNQNKTGEGDFCIIYMKYMLICKTDLFVRVAKEKPRKTLSLKSNMTIERMNTRRVEARHTVSLINMIINNPNTHNGLIKRY